MLENLAGVEAASVWKLAVRILLSFLVAPLLSSVRTSALPPLHEVG